VAAQQALAAG